MQKRKKSNKTENDYLESIRISFVLKGNIILFTSITIGVVLLIITKIPILLLATITVGLISRSLINEEKKKFYDEYKRVIVLETFKEIFSNIYYDHNQGIDINKIIDCDILPEIDSHLSYDYLKATINDIEFECADVTIYDKKKTKNKDEIKNILFKGQWYIFQLKQKYMSDIQIVDKNFKYNKRIVEAFKKLKSNKEVKNFIFLETDNIKFNELFNLYTIVDFDAINFLTPEIINNIIQLKKKIYGELLICVHDNKLHIAVNNFYNNFEPKIHRKVNIEKDKQKIRKELEDIANFIIDFNLLDTNN